jgi:hypothetical protein
METDASPRAIDARKHAGSIKEFLKRSAVAGQQVEDETERRHPCQDQRDLRQNHQPLWRLLGAQRIVHRHDSRS